MQTVVKDKPKATGEVMGAAYQQTLPQFFRDSFPSLPTIYDDISAAMHGADANAALFEGTCVKIDEHFDALRLHKLNRAKQPATT